VAICITLDYFGAGARKYHIYKLSSLTIAESEHYHDYYQLCYVSKGALNHCQGSNSVSLEAGDAFLIPPGFSHSISFIRENSELYSLSFHASIFHSGFPKSNVYKFLTAISLDETEDKNLSVQQRVSLNEPHQIVIKSLLDCLINEEKIDPPAELSAAASIIAAALCELSQAYLIKDENLQKYSIASAYGKTMDNCLSYIKQNLDRQITTEELTSLCAMSKSTFYQLFLQTTGMPLRKYINSQRIEAAKDLISTRPDLSLSEIGDCVGYLNSSTFYRNFTDEVGVSPQEYRNAFITQK